MRHTEKTSRYLLCQDGIVGYCNANFGPIVARKGTKVTFFLSMKEEVGDDVR